MKNRPQQSFGPLMLNKVPNRSWEIISMDLIVRGYSEAIQDTLDVSGRGVMGQLYFHPRTA